MDNKRHLRITGVLKSGRDEVPGERRRRAEEQREWLEAKAQVE